MNEKAPSAVKRALRRLMHPDILFWELAFVSWFLLLPYIMTAHGHLDWSRHALGRDFVNFWTAGHLTFTPHRIDIFTPAKFLDWEHRLFDPLLPFHFWSYPPVTLFLVAPLALFPYIPGLIVWTLAGLAALVPAARAFFKGRQDRWLLVAAPAVAINIGLGQNGAFSAALLLGGLAFWRDRPRLAGVLLGLLIFKPQIALLLPVAVLAERRWTVMVTAGITAVLVLLLSIPAFGLDAWKAFFGPTLATQSLMLSQGRGPFQWMMPSAFMAARVLGVRSDWAMAVQAPFSIFGVWLVWKAYRSDADNMLKAAVLMMATFVASPQAFNYDLIPAAAATIVLWRRDGGAVARGLCLMLWALPVFMIAAQAVHIVVAPVVLAWGAWKLLQLTKTSHPRKAGGLSEDPAAPGVPPAGFSGPRSLSSGEASLRPGGRPEND